MGTRLADSFSTISSINRWYMWAPLRSEVERNGLAWSSGPMIQKSYPRIGIPVPSRTKHAAGHRCWMKIGVCVICPIELRFGLHRTGSRKFYSTLMKDLIDDCYAMIARRPCHGSWILRVWSVNESWDSVAFHPRSPSQMWSPECRAENIGISSSKLQSGIILYKRIYDSDQNNF